MKTANIFFIYVLAALLMTGCSRTNTQAPNNPSIPKPTAQNSDTSQSTVPSQTVDDQANNPEKISSDEAKAIALEHAGLTEDQVTIIKCELDQDYNEWNYDIEFYTEDQLEYDYEIDAYSGRILGYDVDGHFDTDGTDQTTVGSSTTGNNSTTENAAITKEEAIKIALEQVPGAAEEHIRELHTDYDNGRLRYEVEIFYEQKEYEFDIDAQNGSILEWDKY